VSTLINVPTGTPLYYTSTNRNNDTLTI